MFSNYLKLAYRNLSRNKTFSLINILGMAIGLTCCFLISMYLVREFGYDKHHALADRIYQVGAISTSEGKSEKYAPAAAPLAPLMQQNFPEIESYLRIT